MTYAQREAFLNRLTTDELKTILRNNGATVSGTKPDLVARILNQVADADAMLTHVSETRLRDYCKGYGLQGANTAFDMRNSIIDFWGRPQNAAAATQRSMQVNVAVLVAPQQSSFSGGYGGVSAQAVAGGMFGSPFQQQAAPVFQQPQLPPSPFQPPAALMQSPHQAASAGPPINPMTGDINHAEIGRLVPDIFFRTLVQSIEPHTELRSRFFEGAQMELRFGRKCMSFQDTGKAAIVDRLIQVRQTVQMTYNAPAVVVTPDPYGRIRLDIPGLYHIQNEPAGQFVLSLIISRDPQTQNTWLIYQVLGEFR